MLDGVMTNPLRTGLFTTLREMGADIEALDSATTAARRSPTCACAPARFKGVEVPAERAPSMIDEYPILAVAAAFAEGTTRMRGLKELRVKESDRLAATADMLRANGVAVEIEGDDLIVHGKGRVPGGGVVATHMDHRIAMSALVMGLASEKPVRIDDAAFIATSFPGFRRSDAQRSAREIFMIIAIDGPAASGKGTLGKRLAAHYGLRHLDTGLIYRAVAKALLDAGEAPDDEAAAIAAARALDPSALRRGGAEDPRRRRGRLGRLRDPGGARGAARLPARFRRAAARRGARRPRHRHRDLPRRRRENLRHRHARRCARAAAPPSSRAAGEAGRRGRRARRHPQAATSATRTAPPRRSKQAPDAHLLDTTHLDIDAAIRAAIDIVEAARAGRGRG